MNIKHAEAVVSSIRDPEVKPSHPDFRVRLMPTVIASILGTLWFPSSVSFAQTSTNSGNAVLEEIRVTATKTGETDLQSTPLTISAITGDELARRNLIDMKEIGLRIPNANFVNLGGFSQAFIRGVGNTSQGAAIGGESNVGFYLDGVYLERGMGANTEFFDVERIEVLRGPQGVLYGRNSTGGAVNIITRMPTDEFDASVGLTLGNYAKRRADLSVGGPIVPGMIAGRISGSINKRDGYVKNLIGPDQQDEDSAGLRGKLLFTPNESVDIVLAGDWYRQRANGAINSLVYIPGANWPTLKAPIPSDFWKANLDLPDKGDDADAYGFSATVDVALSGELKFRSITAYREWDREFQWDIDNNQVNAAHLFLFDKFDTFTQEFQLSGAGERLSWQTGLFYYTLDNLWGGDFVFDAIRPGLVRSPTLDLSTEAWAAYANLTFAITEKLSFSAGARYSDEEKDAKTNINLRLGALQLASIAIETEKGWDEVSPRFVLDYSVNEDLMLYASATKGFRAGQIADSNPPPYPTEVEPETLWSYEIGAKSTWMDGRVRANAAVFSYDYTNIQQATEEGLGISVVTNAASGKVKGVELELTAIPVPDFTLNATISYLDTEYGSFRDRNPVTGAVVNASGNQFRYTPDFKATLGASYDIRLGDSGTLGLRADVTFVDKIYFSVANDPRVEQGSYSIANASIEYTREGSPWSVLAFGKNLTEEEYYRDKSFVGLVPGAYQGYVGDPRTYGVQVVYRY